jgi:hypothetical protein
MNQIDYKYYVTIGGTGETEVHPLGEFRISYDRIPDPCYDLRRVFKGDMIFVDDYKNNWLDFTTIKNTPSSTEIKIKIRSSTDSYVSDWWSGYFYSWMCEHDLDDCSLKITPNPDDYYRPLLEKADENYNILEASPTYSVFDSIANVLGSFQQIEGRISKERLTITEASGTCANLPDSGSPNYYPTYIADNNISYASNPSDMGWNLVYSVYDYVSGDEWDVTTKWVRVYEIVEAGSQTANFVEAETCGSEFYLFKKYVNPYFNGTTSASVVDSCIKTNCCYMGNNPATITLKKTISNRLRGVKDIISGIISFLGFNGSYLSKFYENHNAGNTWNYVTHVDPNPLNDMVMGQKSDVRNQTEDGKSGVENINDSSPATLGNITFAQLMLMLRKLHDIRWKVDTNGNLIIEHSSWFAEELGNIDLFAEINPTSEKSYSFKKNKYKYVEPLLPRFEKFSFQESRSIINVNLPTSDYIKTSGFSNHVIEYAEQNTTPEQTIEYNNDLLVTDTNLIYVANSQISSNGFVLFERGANLTYRAFTLTNNVNLSWMFLIPEYWTYKRVLTTGNLYQDLGLTDKDADCGFYESLTFNSIQRNIEQEDIEYKLCGNSLDVTKLVRTGLGESMIDGGEFDMETGWINFHFKLDAINLQSARIWLNAYNAGSVTLKFMISTYNVVTLDWNDGTTQELTGDDTLDTYNHTYSPTFTGYTKISGDVDRVLEFWNTNSTIGGDMSKLDRFTSLKTLHLENSGMTGSLKSIKPCTKLTYINIDNTTFNGSVNDFNLFENLTEISFSGSSITGNVASLDMSKMTAVDGSNTSIDYTYEEFTLLDGASIDFSDCNLTATQVDNFIIGINAGGAINGTLIMDGNNAARTSASDTDYVSLVGKGWTLTFNVVDSWTNQGYDVFTVDGLDIDDAQNTGGGLASCKSNLLSVISGETYRVTFDLSNSSFPPVPNMSCVLSNISGGNVSNLVNITPSNGSKSMDFTVTSTDNAGLLLNTGSQLCQFTLTNFGMIKL